MFYITIPTLFTFGQPLAPTACCRASHAIYLPYYVCYAAWPCRVLSLRSHVLLPAAQPLHLGASLTGQPCLITRRLTQDFELYHLSPTSLFPIMA